MNINKFDNEFAEDLSISLTRNGTRIKIHLNYYCS